MRSFEGILRASQGEFLIKSGKIPTFARAPVRRPCVVYCYFLAVFDVYVLKFETSVFDGIAEAGFGALTAQTGHFGADNFAAQAAKCLKHTAAFFQTLEFRFADIDLLNTGRNFSHDRRMLFCYHFTETMSRSPPTTKSFREGECDGYFWQGVREQPAVKALRISFFTKRQESLMVMSVWYRRSLISVQNDERGEVGTVEAAFRYGMTG